MTTKQTTKKQETATGLKFIKLVAKQITTKGGQQFLNFKTTKNGRFIDFRFRKEVDNPIKKEGKYLVEIELEHLNLDTNREYPCYWYGGSVTIVEDIVATKQKPISSDDLPD